MPLFSLGAYQNLLAGLRENGYPLLPVSSMPDSLGQRAIFLRHDIDFSIECALPMAELEASMGVKASYYILLNGPYSMHSENQQHLKHVVQLGHEIGLHYDMRDYPDSPSEQRSQLEREIRQLSVFCDAPVCTITMHEPHRGHGDPFLEEQWVHPHQPSWFNTVDYVSDSCRGWRDENLRQFFQPEGPERLLLLTHPELWLDGTIEDRMTYLNHVLIPRMPSESLAYFEQEVPSIWNNHVGAIAHDLSCLLYTSPSPRDS